MCQLTVCGPSNKGEARPIYGSERSGPPQLKHLVGRQRDVKGYGGNKGLRLGFKLEETLRGSYVGNRDPKASSRDRTVPALFLTQVGRCSRPSPRTKLILFKNTTQPLPGSRKPTGVGNARPSLPVQGNPTANESRRQFWWLSLLDKGQAISQFNPP